jgi:hypothetical protein
MKKVLSLLMIFVLLLSFIPIQTANAATKLNKSKITLNVNDTYKLVLSGEASDIKWSTSNKSVATVSKGKVKAICGGSAVISAKVGNKQYKCTVTVKDKKADIIYTAYIFDDSTISEYAENYKEENPDVLAVKVYDKEHIKVTIWESKRLSALKEINDNLDEALNSFITDESYEGVFTKIEADKLLQNITLQADGKKYKDSFAGVAVILTTGIISDTIQALNLIKPKDRVCNLVILDKDSGETLYPEEE